MTFPSHDGPWQLWPIGLFGKKLPSMKLHIQKWPRAGRRDAILAKCPDRGEKSITWGLRQELWSQKLVIEAAKTDSIQYAKMTGFLLVVGCWQTPYGTLNFYRHNVGEKITTSCSFDADKCPNPRTSEPFTEYANVHLWAKFEAVVLTLLGLARVCSNMSSSVVFKAFQGKGR